MIYCLKPYFLHTIAQLKRLIGCKYIGFFPNKQTFWQFFHQTAYIFMRRDCWFYMPFVLNLQCLRCHQA